MTGMNEAERLSSFAERWSIVRGSLGRVPWKALLELALFVAAAASAFYAKRAAEIAAEQTKFSKEVPFQSALYTARVNALQEYARAYQKYANSLHAVLIDLPYEVDAPEKLQKFYPWQMQRNAIVARKIIDTHAEYVGSVKGVSALWSDQTQLGIGVADQLGATAARCFFILGAHPYNPDLTYFADLRKEAADPCKGINEHTDIMAFEAKSEEVLTAMRDELKAQQNDLVPQ